MREFKFRIWDKTRKIFLPLEHKYTSDYSCPPAAPLIDITGRLWNWGCQHWGMDNELTENPENYVMQQYTGLKDKNKKEIYEGDILKTQGQLLGEYFRQGVDELPAYPNNTFYTWLSKVIWSESYASFLLEYIDQPNYQGRGHFSEGMIGVAPWGEIIGNIFENPELLK